MKLLISVSLAFALGLGCGHSKAKPAESPTGTGSAEAKCCCTIPDSPTNNKAANVLAPAACATAGGTCSDEGECRGIEGPIP